MDYYLYNCSKIGTENALKEDKERYLNAGMDSYISKPFDQKELLRVISNFERK